MNLKQNIIESLDEVSTLCKKAKEEGWIGEMDLTEILLDIGEIRELIDYC